MKKWLRRTLIVLLVLLAVVVLIINFFLGTVITKSLETAGPIALGVPITLDDAEFRLLRGHVTLRGFVLGNPKGFKTEKAISVDEVTVDLDPKTLLSDTLVIKRIYVNAPDITYELGLGKSNIGRILEQAEGPDDKDDKAEAEKKEEPAKDEKGGKKVVINDFLIENGRVRISTTLAMGAAAPVPLPTIHLKDIGKEKQGTSPLDVFKQVLGAIVGSVTKIGADSEGAAADASEKAAKAVEEGAEGKTNVIGSLMGIFKSGEASNSPAENKTE